MISQYLSMPFQDLVRIPFVERNNKSFIIALQQRPELACIDWTVEDPEDLARQLWMFRTEEVDVKYNRSWYALSKLLMEIHRVPPATIRRVQAITSEWRVAKTSKRHHEKHPSAFVSDEQKALTRQRKAHYARRRSMERRSGKNMPLLTYIDVNSIEMPTPERLHKEALKHRHMYSSSLSFNRNLRNFFTALKYRDSEVVELLHDDQNYDCDQWDKTQRRSGSSSGSHADTHRRIITPHEAEQISHAHLTSHQERPSSLPESAHSHHLEPFDQREGSESTSSLAPLRFDDDEDPLQIPIGTTDCLASEDEAFPDWDSLGM